MTAQLRELLDLFIRWVHLIAGIMWIGNSMLFNWLDRNLEKPAGNSDPNYQGKIWLLHSGAFYDVDKKLLR
ncbi:MAG TPA: urate hydroxylase PuuD, partial [Polyangiaceae bacterium]|nr:urate hydroxylase PuuD [Polyangiaceae bacterium]